MNKSFVLSDAGIAAQHLTVTYANHKGIQDISFEVQPGHVLGYLGPNGAGKSTTIRALIGFVQAQQGHCTIGGLDCFQARAAIMAHLGYIPGEIYFPAGMRCDDFLAYQLALRKVRSTDRMQQLMRRFELDGHRKIRQLSKGMKQKLGIICAFMHDPDIYILDEPTSGLDPLMQNVFIDLILEEKKRGKTILMSSHLIEEVEKTSDEVVFIREGKLVGHETMTDLAKKRQRIYQVYTPDYEILLASSFPIQSQLENGVEMKVSMDRLDEWIALLATIHVEGLNVRQESLEDLFLPYYEEGRS